MASCAWACVRQDFDDAGGFSPSRGNHFGLAGQRKLDLNQDFYACAARNYANGV